MPVTAEDLESSVAACVSALHPAAGADWSRPAGSLTWSCRDTAEHLADDLFFYAAQLGSGIEDHPLPFADAAAHPGGSVGSIRVAADTGGAGIVEVVGACGALLMAAVRAARPGKRGYHIFGPADAEASAAMGIVETVVHTHDLAQGLGVAWTPDAGVCRRVLARLMPDVASTPDPWADLLWATGRADLPGRPRRTSWRWWN